MSIANEISRLQTAKADLKTAIEGKGVTVAANATLDAYADLVDAIETGGGGGSEYEDFSGGNITSITSHGTEYILTDYLGSMSALYSIKLADSNASNYEGYFATAVGSTTTAVQRRSTNSALNIKIAGTEIANVTYPGYSSGNPIVVTFSAVGKNTNTADKALVIFGSYYGGNLESTKSASTFYGLNIFDANATAVAKFRPWLEGGVPCVKDLVSGSIFYNSGTGTFDYTV